MAAERENKEATADEVAELGKIFGSGKKGDKDYVLGQLGKLEADLELAEKFEAKVEHYSQKRNPVKPQAGEPNADEIEADPSTVRLSKIRIPASARYSHANLKAFRANLFASAEHAERAAYAAGQFVLATLGKSEVAAEWCKAHGINTRFQGALQEGSNTLGGFLVPTEMERTIITLREERGVLRREAQVVPMSSDTLTLPRRSGGMTAYFVGESTAGTASDPTFDQIQLSAKKLMAYTTMSSEVSEDAVISLGDWVASEIAYAFADKEDACGFNGDGTSTYGGMTGLKNALAAGSVFTATGHAEFSTLTLADFHGMLAKLPLYATNMNTKWYISKAGFNASMERLMAAGGGNTWATLSSGQSVPRFLGYDVVFVQVMNSALTGNTGVAGGVYVGDLKQTIKLGSRRGMSLASSTDFLFSSDAIAIKGTERFDAVVAEKGTASVAGSMVSLTFG